MADGRGDYRSIYVSFWDDPDTHALSDRAYRILTTLKGTLPASGLGVVYPAQLAERCNCNVQQLEKGLAELEEPKRGSRRGWLVRDRNLVWIVNALKYEPALRSNNWKHRAFLRDRLLAPLGESSPLVLAFRDHYPEWFTDTSRKGNGTVEVPNGMGSDRVTDGYPMGEDRVSKHITNPILSNPNQAVVGTTAERAEQEPTTTTESALAEQLTTASARGDLELVLANVPNRAAWTTDLAEQLESVGAEVLGQALHDFVANGEANRPHAGRFRGYVKRIRAAAAVSGPNGTTAPDDEEAEAARKHRLSIVETRRAQTGGDEWWERMQRESPSKRIADIYAFAYQQLNATSDV